MGLHGRSPAPQVPASTTQTDGLVQLEQVLTVGPGIPQNDCALSARTQQRQFAVDPAALQRTSCTQTFLPAQKGAAGGVGHVICGGHVSLSLWPFFFIFLAPVSRNPSAASDPPGCGHGRVVGSQRLEQFVSRVQSDEPPWGQVSFARLRMSTGVVGHQHEANTDAWLEAPCGLCATLAALSPAKAHRRAWPGPDAIRPGHGRSRHDALHRPRPGQGTRRASASSPRTR